jgi:hypothetical protein
LALATIAEDLTPGALHDFTHHVAPALAGLEHLADQTEGRLPTGLESYVMTRLGGYRRSTYLDSLDLFVAIKTCELIGAVEVFGRTANLNRLTDEEWRVAGAAGFAIADGGAASVRDFLGKLQATFPYRRSGREGPQTLSPQSRCASWRSAVICNRPMASAPLRSCCPKTWPSYRRWHWCRCSPRPARRTRSWAWPRQPVARH